MLASAPTAWGDISNQKLEDRHNRAVVGVVDVILDGVAGQGGEQGLDGGIVLVAFLHNQQVGVGLGSFRRSILGGQGVLADGEASLHSVVAVDDSEVNVGDSAGQLGSLNLLNLDVVGVLLDVVDGGSQAGAVADGDDALGGQQLQSAGLVGGIVGNCDHSTVSDVLQVAALARVDAERLVVDRADADQMGAVLLVEALEVGTMLEVVGVDLAALGDEVGLDVVAELDDLEGDALLGQNVLGGVQNLSVGRGRSGNLQGGASQVRGGFLGSSLTGGSGLAPGGGGAFSSGRGCGRTAGGQAQGQGTGEGNRNQLFHSKYLLFMCVCVNVFLYGQVPQQ